MTDTLPNQVRDSRRLTGPNLVWDAPGAVLDVVIDGSPGPAIREWEVQARRVLDAVGWPNEQARARAHRDGALLAISAPMDALYAATEVNEWAWAAALRVLEGGRAPSLDDAVEQLAPIIRDERNPALIALQDAAAARGVPFITDDDYCSVGMGKGSMTWPVQALPSPDAVPWDEIFAIPVALITGTNGKTTTVRLLASIAEAAGHTPGMTSTDGIVIGEELVEPGDYSGPGGGRKVLRDQRVDVALLETARGGMLRRGLTVRRAKAALITNVAEDHLGEHGVYDADELAHAKWVISRSIGPEGRLVLNFDERRLRELAQPFPHPITWFSVTQPCDGDTACELDGDTLILRSNGQRTQIANVADVPITLGGAARHNVANALAAMGVAHALGYTAEQIREGLEAFTSTPSRNPGRLNVYELKGARIIVDFAHNPHGLAALVDMAKQMPAERRMVVIGQAGDRDDDAIRALAQEAAKLEPAHVLVKDMDTYARGRALGAVAEILVEELRAVGVDESAIQRVHDEADAVRVILDWVRPGDLVLLTVHEDRERVTRLLMAAQSG